MDGFCLKTGINGIGTISVGGPIDVRTKTSQVTAVGRSSKSTAGGAVPSRYSFRFPLRSLWPVDGGGGGGGVKDKKLYNGMCLDDAVVENGDGKRVYMEDGEESVIGLQEGRKGNWVLKILHVRSLWGNDGGEESTTEEEGEEEGSNNGGGDDDRDGDRDRDSGDGCRVDDEEKEMEFDRDSFSKMVKTVSLAEAKLFAQMSYLGSLAYSIPNIKQKNLLKSRGLRFVTSSMEKKESSVKQNLSSEGETNEPERPKERNEKTDDTGYRISASAAYKIAASAASYLRSHTQSILPFRSSTGSGGSGGSSDNVGMLKSEMASFMATDSVTAVVAAKEEVKQAVADDLNSTHSTPCEWYACDEDQAGTRIFVIQGSESLAAWKANLLFEPVQFEGMDVIVHRGIYEAAKGIYDQMLPEVHAHLESRGKNPATFRFTGHSLGGSLSLLVNLMLLIRGEVRCSSLLPVVTFGSPSIMCGGDQLLRKLGLPRSHLQAITMHRDIVPRAFSCNYPNHVAELLKAVNGNFRNHPCLNNEKVLYAPMGELLILQPDEKFSPQHDLLPRGSGFYFLTCPFSDNDDNNERQLRAAKMYFLNSPHPLEILSDRSAYGSEGSIVRDHDMSSYIKCIRGVIRDELKRIRTIKEQQRRRRQQQQRGPKVWWHLTIPRRLNAGVIVGKPFALLKTGRERVDLSGIFRSGRESIKRFSRFVVSQRLHLVLVVLLPARLLLLGAYGVIS